MSMRDKMEAMVRSAQDEICEAVSKLDGTSFHEDTWERPGGGGGTSRVIQGGNVFEKAGVNVSVVHGTLSEEAARSMGGGQELGNQDLDFFATGVSLVIHPHNPMAPTAHANFRYFERGDGSKPGSWWFGGGADLTPSYLFEEPLDVNSWRLPCPNCCSILVPFLFHFVFFGSILVPCWFNLG